MNETAIPAKNPTRFPNIAPFGVNISIAKKLPGLGVATVPPPNSWNNPNEVAIPPIVAKTNLGFINTNGK